jgi:hypothetical protein
VWSAREKSSIKKGAGKKSTAISALKYATLYKVHPPKLTKIQEKTAYRALLSYYWRPGKSKR